MARGFYEIDENGVWHEIDPFKKADLIVPVRCKDCVRRGTSTCIVMEAGGGDGKDDWFCADGEKKEGS